MKEDAALWRTLVPINRRKADLSCSKTNFTVLPENIKPLQHYMHDFSDQSKITHVLDKIRKATASSSAPCLSNIVGT